MPKSINMMILVYLFVFLSITFASATVSSAGGLSIGPSPAPIEKAYKASPWRFYASSELPSGGFYFWINPQGRYFFQYIQVNKMTSSNIINQCHKGLTDQLAAADVQKLKDLVASIGAFQQSESVPKPVPGRMSRIRTLTFREHIDGRDKTRKFYYKDEPDELFTEFYTFANRFRGEMTTPCPPWP